MDAARNPYSPGAGRRPAALVGRDLQVEGWRVARGRVALGRDAQPQVLYGLRGVGKTVLLSEFARLVERDDWIVAQVEAGTVPLRTALSSALRGPLSDLARPSAGIRLRKGLKTALSFFRVTVDSSGTWSFGLDLDDVAGGGADTGDIDADLSKLITDLAAAAAEDNRGLAILIDEAQDLDDADLRAVCTAAHLASQRGSAVLFALAGLPSLPRVLAEARSYAERLFAFHPIEQLAPGAAFAALVDPAAGEGVAWDQDALRHVVTATDGYPYFLQQFGQETWNAASGPIITLADARLGEALGTAMLDNGFFRARWDRATRSEKQYLRAMAATGDAGSSSGDVARRLGRRQEHLGPARSKLISKGLIFAPEHGVVQFTVPGMAAFVTRQPDE